VRGINPIYADGPLKGEQFIPDSVRHPVAMMDPAGESPVMYHFHRFALLGRVIWVGATCPADEIADADLFDLIVSDRAKQASE
jgi:hypothetical protein